MCDPVSMGLASGGLKLAQTTAQYFGQGAAYAANKRAANLTYANTVNTINEKATQIDAQHSEDVFDSAIKSITDQSSIVASASASGLSAGSLSHALNATDFGNARDATLSDINARNQRSQLGQDLVDANLTRTSNINKVAKANPLSLVLGVAGAATAGADEYSKVGGQF